MKTLTKAKDALLSNFSRDSSGWTVDKGYARWPQDNLIPGIKLAMFEEDLRRGDGNELRMKFCAVHSSAALAVNCFALFKEQPEVSPNGW